MDEGWEDEGWIKDAVWQWHSDAWIQPHGKHPKTFILYLPSKLSLTHATISSLANSGYLEALVFISVNLLDLCPVPIRHSAFFSATLLLSLKRAQMASLLQPCLCCSGSVPTAHSLTLPAETGP